ncbi:MAG TPA: M20 family metallopeptidase [Verrucomicrobiae bacterium]|nr:M20 family metallopeptidase [Verrucomicrobiae bacterium]
MPNVTAIATIRAAMIPARELYLWLKKKEAPTLKLLKRFVEMESFTYEKAAVDAFAAAVAAEWKSRGASAQILPNRECGAHVRAEIDLSPKGARAKQIMVLGHMDTVYPSGTLAKMPFRMANGYAHGPGTFDMKGGLVMALVAVDALQAKKIPAAKIVFLWTADEETGSKHSRKIIEREARKSRAVFVLEPSFGPDGCAKTRRKGVGEAEIIVTGRSAHAGIAPEAGVNAVHELALQITRLLEWSDPRRGITIQSNVIEGGTASNVVPERARALVDVRVARLDDMSMINKKLRTLKPVSEGAEVKVTGGVNRPPMERTAKIAELFGRAQKIAEEIGFHLGEASTGGGSDGNFTAALGIPTLDGLGAVGDGAHSPSEHIRISALSQRAALLAGLLASI